MYPLPCNPKVVIHTTPKGAVMKVASNIAPLPELTVVITQNEDEFKEAAAGTMFNQSVNKD